MLNTNDGKALFSVKRILNPFAELSEEKRSSRPLLGSLVDKTIVFWHDSSPEADVIFPPIKAYLESKGVRRVLLARQPGPAHRPQERNLALVRQADAAVIGVAW
jgi:hypothetical protein